MISLHGLDYEKKSTLKITLSWWAEGFSIQFWYTFTSFFMIANHFKFKNVTYELCIYIIANICLNK